MGKNLTVLKNLHPEDILLLSCIRCFVDKNNLDLLRDFNLKEMDWGYVIRTSYWHGVLPLLCYTLQAACREAIPGDIQIELQDMLKKTALRNLAMASELLRLLDLFQAHGIRAIPFKGPLLASSIYGNLSLRQFGDLDILVPREDASRAKDLLKAEGYQWLCERHKKHETAITRSDSHYHLHNPDSRIKVEVHWRISQSIYLSKVDVDGLWKRAKLVAFCGRKVQSFSSEDTLLVLCEHGAKHNWESLLWICDVALLAKANDLNWTLVIKQAQEAGSQRTLLLGLLLANHFLGACLPVEINEMIEADPELLGIAAEEMKGLFVKKDEEETSLASVWNGANQMLLYLKATDQLQHRMRCCLALFFAPTLADIEIVSLPKCLFPLYYPVRPLRIVRTLFKQK